MLEWISLPLYQVACDIWHNIRLWSISFLRFIVFGVMRLFGKSWMNTGKMRLFIVVDKPRGRERISGIRACSSVG